MEYEIYRVVWWVLLGVLLSFYAVMDGFDLGASGILPFAAKTDNERRMIINSVGPFWEGNQVWLLIAGGVIFAAFPYVYAVSFSGFYLAIALLLLALITRPLAFKYRSKEQGTKWRTVWDWIHFGTGVVPALLTGVAVGNALLGVPFNFDADSLMLNYTGGFFGLLRPFAVLIGLISLTMFIKHGAIYIAMKVDDPVGTRAAKIAIWASVAMLLLFVIALIWGIFINGYVITSNINYSGYSNPLNKTAAIQMGAWFANYISSPWKFIAPVLVIVSLICTIIAVIKQRYVKAFIISVINIFATMATAGFAMFPFLLPSITNPNESLTIWDSSSSLYTLKALLIITVIMLPIMILYTAWVYKMLRGKITLAIFNNSKDVY